MGKGAAESEVGDGRRHVAEALFERVDVLGGQRMTVRLTELAISNGFSAVLPAELAISVNGRGGRI